MKRKDLPLVLLIAGFSAIITMFIANLLFHAPPRNTKVPQMQAINASFPDVKNDSAYSSILNNAALDPTQPVQIGNSQNSVPFQ